MADIRSHDPIGSLIGAPVATIRPSDTLRAAATELAADRVGLLVVVDARGVHGVLSERDVIAAISDDADLDDARVRDHATEQIVQVEEDVSVLDAAAAMSDAEVRHLGVSRDGVTVGVVSVRDILEVLLADHREATA
ncbi:MAG: CBS domain-containing protein [Nitriliruptoraceae bacterium]